MNKYILDTLQKIEIEVIKNESLSEEEKINLLFKNKEELLIDKILNNKDNILKNKKDINSYLSIITSDIIDYLNIENFSKFDFTPFGIVERTTYNIEVKSMINFIEEGYIYLILYLNGKYHTVKKINTKLDDIIISDTGHVYLTYDYKKYCLIKHDNYKYIEIGENIRITEN